MDGYALDSASLTGEPPFTLPVSGESRAGHPLAEAVEPGSCCRIFTGAAMPPGTDAVVIQEDCDALGDGRVRIRVPVRAGDNRRDRGHDVRRGERLLSSGQRIGPFEQAWLAACGLDRVDVIRRPRVGVFSTGDELVEAGFSLGPGQIFDANRRALLTLLETLPVSATDYGIVADDRDALRATLERGAAECDALLTSGGVSVGAADHVRQLLEELGKLDFWRLNLKPGKPMAVGRIRDCQLFGLPGNPVSTVVTFLLVARPALLRLAGLELKRCRRPPPRFRAELLDPIRHRPGREEYQRGRLDYSDGSARVRVNGDQSSNRLATFADADCLIRIPKASGDLQPGSAVEVLPLTGLR